MLRVKWQVTVKVTWNTCSEGRLVSWNLNYRQEGSRQLNRRGDF